MDCSVKRSTPEEQTQHCSTWTQVPHVSIRCFSNDATWGVGGFEVYCIWKLMSQPWSRTHISHPLEQTPALTSLPLKEDHFICMTSQSTEQIYFYANSKCFNSLYITFTRNKGGMGRKGYKRSWLHTNQCWLPGLLGWPLQPVLFS